MDAVYKEHQQGTGLVKDYKDGAVIGFTQILLHVRAFAKRGVRPEDLGHTSFPKAEEGETLYMMVGEFKDDSPVDDILADHHILADGYISIVAHNINSSDHEEIARLNGLGFNEDF